MIDGNTTDPILREILLEDVVSVLEAWFDDEGGQARCQVLGDHVAWAWESAGDLHLEIIPVSSLLKWAGKFPPAQIKSDEFVKDDAADMLWNLV